MWHSPYKLYLYPENADIRIELALIAKTLKNLEFIDQEIATNRYATGNSFVSLLTFMGCSPNIELEPQKDKPFCYIELHTSNEQKFYSGVNTKAAVCPECKIRITDINNPEGMTTTCPDCKNEIKISSLNWRKSAFIAKTCIAIGNIYESEAIPNDQLLDALKNLNHSNWKYAYIRELAE